MNTILLIFFAIPLAVIIFSTALQKILKCPVLVSGIIFAIGIIVTFIIGNLNILVATIVYMLISYITALITCLINKYFRHMSCYKKNDCNCTTKNNRENDLLTISSSCSNNENGELMTISSNCANGNTNDLLTISCNNNTCNCNNNNRCESVNNNSNQINTIDGVIRIVDNNGNTSCANDQIMTRINVMPNNANNGRTGCICGKYRRR